MKRKVYLDILRIVSIFLVLFNHLPGYRAYFDGQGPAEAVYLFLAAITRINVPMFAMISGALLLGREESFRELWNKRIMRFLLIIPIFTTLLYLEFVGLTRWEFSFNTLIRGIFAGDIKHFDSYWFLYAYLGFLLMLPFLRKIARQMTRQDFRLLMVLHIIFLTIVPLTNYTLLMLGAEKFVVSHNICVQLSTVTLLFYPLIGYYIDTQVDVLSISRKQWTNLAVASVIGIAITCAVTYTYGEAKQNTQNYLNLFNYLPVITLFLAVKAAIVKCKQTADKPVFKKIEVLSSLIFGIYLLDNFLKLPLYNTLNNVFANTLGDVLFSLLWCLVSFIGCGFITHRLKRIPYINKLL